MTTNSWKYMVRVYQNKTPRDMGLDQKSVIMTWKHAEESNRQDSVLNHQEYCMIFIALCGPGVMSK